MEGTHFSGFQIVLVASHFSLLSFSCFKCCSQQTMQCDCYFIWAGPLTAAGYDVEIFAVTDAGEERRDLAFAKGADLNKACMSHWPRSEFEFMLLLGLSISGTCRPQLHGGLSQA